MLFLMPLLQLFLSKRIGWNMTMVYRWMLIRIVVVILVIVKTMVTPRCVIRVPRLSMIWMQQMRVVALIVVVGIMGIGVVVIVVIVMIVVVVLMVLGVVFYLDRYQPWLVIVIVSVSGICWIMVIVELSWSVIAGEVSGIGSSHGQNRG